MNHKGTNKLISVYWFFILVIIAGGIVMMVNVFYSSPYDVRETEVELLAKKIANCVMQGGEMSSELASSTGVLKPSFEDHFMSVCGLNFEVETEFERPQYYVELDIYKTSNKRDSLVSISEGNVNWKEDCGLKDTTQDKTARCLEKEFYVVDSVKELYLVKILTVVGKVAENVK